MGLAVQRLGLGRRVPQASIDRWSSCKATPAKLEELCTVGQGHEQRRRHSNFLRRELCVRLAQSVAQLKSLPDSWFEEGPLRDVIDFHTQSIESLELCPDPTTVAEDIRFNTVVKDLYAELGRVGNVGIILEYLKELVEKVKDQPANIQYQVNKVMMPFFTLMSGVRFLLQHYTETQNAGRTSGFSGPVQFSCRPASVANRAASRSASSCKAALGQSPEILVQGDVLESLTYVPAILDYTLTEIFKNACRAVVDKHAEAGQTGHLPPVVCNIKKSSDGLTITVSDEGCGMSEQQLDRAWDFMHSTYESSVAACQPKSSGLAGHGVGLTLSRMYVRYFGGELSVSSQEGLGTTVSIHLNASSLCKEVLP